MKVSQMRTLLYPGILLLSLGQIALLFGAPATAADSSRPDVHLKQRIWDHDNLFAWEVANYDTKKRDPEERARMLERLGFKHYIYLGSADPLDASTDVNVSQQDVDKEIEAMQRHRIDIVAWYFWINSNDTADVPLVTATLQSFKRHHIHPDIWVTNSYAYLPKTPEEWEAKARGRLPGGVAWPRTAKE